MEGTTPQAHRIIVLTSGLSRGTNLVAMHRYFVQNNLPVEICCVVVTRRSAPVVEACQQRALPSRFVSSKDMAQFERNLASIVKEQQIELIVLAGFMKQLSAQFIDSIGIPILNIHPALLPKHGGKGLYGMNVHKAVYDSGDTHSGVTIHFVDPDYDKGPIWIQHSIDISDCISPQEIASKVLALEHQSYGPAIWKLLSKQ